MNPKVKGDNFERKVAKEFQSWYGKEVKRAPLSGMNVFKYDVISDERFPFLIQCKKQEAWRVESLLDSGRGLFASYITEVDEMKNYLLYDPRKVRILVIARNRSAIYVVIEDVELDKIENYVEFRYDLINHLEIYWNGRKFYVFSLSDFLLNLPRFEISQ
jgi:hypothetical protein